MAKIIEINHDTNSTGTSITATLPAHQTDDLLCCWVAKDATAGTGPVAPGGWTTLTLNDSAPTNKRIAFAYKIAASASETNPNFTSSDSDGWSVISMVIRGADTTTPIHQDNDVHSASAWDRDLPTVTTTNDDCLLLYCLASASVATNTPKFQSSTGIIDWGPMIGDGNVHVGLGHGYQKTAGTTETGKCLNLHSTISLSCLVVAINDDGSSGYESGYILNSDSELLSPITGTGTRHFGTSNVAASTVFTTFNGQTIGAPNLMRGGGVSVYLAGTNIESRAGTLGWKGVLIQLSAAINLTGKKIILHHGPPGVSFSFVGDLDDEGIIFVIADSSGNAKGVQTCIVTEDFPAGDKTPGLWDADNTSFVVDEDVGFDITDVEYIGMLWDPNFVGGTNKFPNIGCAAIVGPVTFGGGSVDAPAEFIELWQGIREHRAWCNRRQGTSQFFLSNTLIFGNHLDQTFVDLSNVSIEFPIVASNTNREYLADEKDIGITIDLDADGGIIARNCIMNGGSVWNFIIAATCSGSADYSGFENYAVINAAITLNSNVPMTRGIFNGCEKITGDGVDFEGCSFINSLDTESLIIDTSTILKDCIFSTETAADYAIEIDAAGTYAFDNVTFDGFTKDLDITASSGTVTINISNGGDTPTYDTAGATVVINNSVTIAVNVKDSSGSNIQNARVYIKAAAGGPETEGTELLNDTTDASGNASVSYNFQSDQPVTGWVRRATGSPLYKQFVLGGTVTSAGYTAAAIMSLDE